MTSQSTLSEVLLAEYAALRSEIEKATERLDRTVGLYVTAVFAITAVVLNPGGELRPEGFLDAIETDPSLTTAALVLPVLNAILLFRQLSLYLHILAQAEYVLLEIRPHFVQNLQVGVLGWDIESSSLLKRTSLSMRRWQHVFFFGLAFSVSVLILWRLFPGGLSLASVSTYAYIVAFIATMTALAGSIRAWRVTENFPFSDQSDHQLGSFGTDLQCEQGSGRTGNG